MRAALTDIALRAAKPPETGTATIWDGSLKYFGARISSGGTKSFIVLLRSGRRQVIGRYPVISLAQARSKAKQLLAERTLGRFQPKNITWDVAIKQFLDERQRKNRVRTHKEYSRTLKRHFTFGPTRLADITRADIAGKLDRLNDAPSQQRNALVYVKMVFKWAEGRGYVDRNPCAALTTSKSVSRAHTLTDDELKRVWVAAEDCGTFGAIVKLLAMTGQRRGEIAALRKEWIHDDTITLPKEITKNGREHSFPVCRTARAIMSGMNCESGLLFPARGKSQTPFNGWSNTKATLDKASGVTGWTLHDLRRTFATRLAEQGTPPHVIERLLNHVTGQISGIAAVYNRASYAQEMREAIEKWDKYFTALLVRPPQARAA